MAWDPTVPNQSNRVRGSTGDLVKIRENFEALDFLIDNITTSGTFSSAVISGISIGPQGWALNASGTALVFDVPANNGSIQFLANGRALFPSGVAGADPTVATEFVTLQFLEAFVATGATLSGLSDTAVSGAPTGGYLAYDGTDWVPSGLTVEQDGGTPTLVRVNRIIASGELEVLSGGPGIAIISGGSGTGGGTVSGSFAQVSGGNQNYAAGLNAVSGLSGLAPPRVPASGEAFVGSLALPIENTGAGAQTIGFRVHVGTAGDETDSVVYFGESDLPNGDQDVLTLPEMKIPFTATGDLVTVSISGTDTLRVFATAEQYAYLRMRDGDSASSVAAPTSKAWMMATLLSGDQTPTASGDFVEFDTVDSEDGSGDITLDIASGIFTLPANRTFVLEATVRAGGNSNAFATLQWHNLSTGQDIGPQTVPQPTTQTTANANLPNLKHIFANSGATTQLAVKIISPSNFTVDSPFSSCAIFEI